MILLVNCILADQPRREFDATVVPRLRGLADESLDLCHLAHSAELPEVRGYSRLILNGSELSAARSNPSDAELFRLIGAFVEQRKPVLGICYGHQLIAKTILGQRACRRAARPEFGWRRLALRPNPLFEGLEEVVSVHSHYDEVCELGDEFEVLAASDDCAVQAFQYAGLPVWGVQFHPEAAYEDGSAMLRENLRTQPLARQHYRDDLRQPEEVRDNLRIFGNFFRMESHPDRRSQHADEH